jgi:hypothetical protein
MMSIRFGAIDDGALQFGKTMPMEQEQTELEAAE